MTDHPAPNPFEMCDPDDWRDDPKGCFWTVLVGVVVVVGYSVVVGLCK